MPVSFSKKIVRRFYVSEQEGGHVDITFPPHGDQKLQAAILELLKTSNNVRRGMLGDDMETQARIKFFDDNALDIDNLTWTNPQTNQEEPCNAQTCPTWKGLVPPDIKVSIVSFFSQKMSLSAPEKNVSSVPVEEPSS